jgi:hypothetical protein
MSDDLSALLSQRNALLTRIKDLETASARVAADMRAIAGRLVDEPEAFTGMKVARAILDGIEPIRDIGAR